MEVNEHKRGTGIVFFICAGLLLISLFADIFLVYSGKLPIKQGDGLAIGFGILAIISTLALGVLDKRGKLCRESVSVKSDKNIKLLTNISKVLVVLISLSFVYYAYELIQNGLKTKSLTPFTPSLIPIGILSLVLISISFYLDKNYAKK